MRQKLTEARLALKWGQEAVVAFINAQQAYFEHDDLCIQIKDPTGMPNEYKLYVIGPPPFPPELRKCAYDAINNLRNALDHAVNEASNNLGSSKPKKCAFPSGDNRQHFIKNLQDKNGKCAGIPSALHPTLEGMKPWWPDSSGDGNLILRNLIFLANPNKHEMPLTPLTISSGVSIKSMQGIRTFCDHVNHIPENGKIHFATLTADPNYRGAHIMIKPRIAAAIRLRNGDLLDATEFFESASKSVDMAFQAIEAVMA